jgi:hypothetical protein
VKITICVPDDAIDVVLESPNSRYWCPRAEWNPETRAGWVHEPQDSGPVKKHYFGSSKVKGALEHLAKNSPAVLARIASGDADGNDGDILLQLCALGEIRYG